LSVAVYVVKPFSAVALVTRLLFDAVSVCVASPRIVALLHVFIARLVCSTVFYPKPNRFAVGPLVARLALAQVQGVWRFQVFAVLRVPYTRLFGLNALLDINAFAILFRELEPIGAVTCVRALDVVLAHGHRIQ